jgi:hypothetical protein
VCWTAMTIINFRIKFIVLEQGSWLVMTAVQIG